MQNKFIKRLVIIILLLFTTVIIFNNIPQLSTQAIAASKKTSNSKASSSKSNSNASSDESPSGTQNPTSIPDSTLVKPSSYPFWLQYWGPWAKGFGAVGTGGAHWTAPLGNGGCVVTSMAIQGARGGLTERAAGKPFNPLWNNGSDFAVGSFSYGGKGMHVIGGTPAPSGGNLSAAQVLAECKKIASAGNYPLIRGNGNQHTVAYWKAGNGKALVYDPSRMSTGNYFAPPYNNVVALVVTGKGTKKFSEDSPGPNQTNSSSNSSNSNSKSGNSSNSSSGSDSGSGVQAYKIKPIFNPFYSPSVHYVPADEQVNESQTNAQAMQIADGLGPTALGSLRVFVGFTAYVYAMLAIVAMLIAMVDLQTGGYIQEKVYANAGTMTKGLFFPGGHFMGVDDGTIAASQKPTTRIVINGTKHYSFILIVLTLVASGSMSWIFGNSIMLVANLLGMI